jgi:tRNA(Leu) C34 or U34 (ribose-2'-O)-methylase TrmL
VLKTPRRIPLYNYKSFDGLVEGSPLGTRVVAIEQGGDSLQTYHHPENAIYLLGAEDHGLPQRIIDRCNGCIEIPSLIPNSYNVATAGSLVMYKRGEQFNVFGKPTLGASL